MIEVMILYPKSEGSRFDMDYYSNRHIPMVREKLGAACKGIAVKEGLGGPEPGSSPSFVALGHLLFDSLEVFQEAFAPHAEAFMADIPNYTNIQPLVQINSVKI
jgi:uncharacterized protein (TIGR02118 family)